MKKGLLFFCSSLLLLLFFACDNTKTYAEKLEDEKKAILRFIDKHDIKTISQKDFEEDTITGENVYVTLSDGIYMSIVDRGSENPNDTIKSGQNVVVRFTEYDIIGGYVTEASNYGNPIEQLNEYPDMFRFEQAGTRLYGEFITGELGIGHNMVNAYQSTSVPAGWLLALKYIRNNAHIRLIVPSKMGHSRGIQMVYPYFYDIRKILLEKNSGEVLEKE
ncbi:MAG: DUF4827 domain-containing protein [Bacteroidales bacterium]|nr:DUF4827 domain-containing protein [Bacteroidales bacterium]